MKPDTKVLIVGGGIAGMACAMEMAKIGAKVLLVDIDPNWRVYGTGITITGPTFRAFRDINLMDQVISEGFACRGARTRTRDGALLQEIVDIGLEPGIPYGGGILRPALHSLLAERVRRSSVEVRLGVTIETIHNKGFGAEVSLSDGSTSYFDLIVGADGISSKVRDIIAPEIEKPRFTGQGAWRVLAPRPADLDMIEMYLSPRIKAGVTPLTEKLLYMFVLTPEMDDSIIPHEDQPARLKQALADFGGLIGDIRDGINLESSIVYRPLKALLVPKPWNRSCVVLIGDAVHSTTPHLASGAGAAIEDAIVLVQELERNDSINSALQSFSERRFARCQDIVETSVKLGKMELSGASGEEQGRVYAEANARLAEKI